MFFFILDRILSQINICFSLIAEEIRENRKSIDKLSGQHEDVGTRSSTSKSVDLLSIDKKIDEIIIILGKQGDRLSKIEKQLGMFRNF